MTDNAKDAVPNILMKIQADIASLQRSVDERFTRIEDVMRKQRRDSAGTLVLMRGVAGEFNARLLRVETTIVAFEAEKL